MADITWQSIKDFSPGIHQTISPNHAPGTASDGTWGCVSDPTTAALIPLPRCTQQVTLGEYFDLMNVAVGDVINPDKYRVVGLKCRGPMFATDAAAGIQPSLSEVFVAFEFWEDDVGGDPDRRHFQILRYRMNSFDADWRDDVWADSYVDVEYETRERARARFEEARSNSAAPNEAGPAVIAWSIGPYLQFWPDDTNPDTGVAIALPGDQTVGLSPSIAQHQGRIVVFSTYNTDSGPDTAWGTNENLYWTEVNDLTTLSALLSGFYAVLPSLDHPAGFRVMESLTADELFLVKSNGGALVLRGDLNDYTSVNYPYVKSASQALVRGTPTTIGMVYPARYGGVYAWSGGQVSEDIANQLDPDFWFDAATGGGGDYQWDLFGEWVIAGTNWLCDIQRGQAPYGWWKLENPDDADFGEVALWSTTFDDRLLVGAATNVTASTDTLLYIYDRLVPRSDYHWVSQPMSVTLEREVSLSEMVIVASGSGEITVRAYTGEDPTGQSATFPVDGTSQAPQFIRQRIAVNGTELTFDVTSTATDPDDPAPTIHEIRWGGTGGNLIPNQ